MKEDLEENNPKIIIQSQNQNEENNINIEKAEIKENKEEEIKLNKDEEINMNKLEEIKVIKEEELLNDNKNDKINDNKEEEKIKDNKEEELEKFKKLEVKEEKEEKEGIIIIKENNPEEKNNKNEVNFDFIKNELDKRDEMIKNLQNEIQKINKKSEEDKSFYINEINKIKQDNKNEINSIKEFFESEIKSIKELISKNNQGEKKENNNQIKRREFNLVKEDLNDLNDKICKFERVFDNKIAFFESSLSKLLEKDQQKEKNNENKINNNQNNNNNNIIEKNQNKNQMQIVDGYLDKDAVIWKDFENQLDVIFSEKYADSKDINKKELDKLEKISIKLNKTNNLINERFSEYFNKKIKPRINDINYENYLYKRAKIFELFINVEEELKNKHNKEKTKKVDVKNFKLKEFRKEFNLDEKEFPDDLLINKYIESNGNLEDLLLILVDNNK